MKKNKINDICWVKTDGTFYQICTTDGYGSNIKIYKKHITFATLNYAWVISRTTFKVIHKIDISMMV